MPHARYLLEIGDLKPEQAAPYACSGLTTYSALRKIETRVLEREPIVIMGAGGLGLMCMTILKAMGGHGALTIAFKNPRNYKSVSAFAPIASSIRCPWGEKALTGYLGSDRTRWREYDATALIEDRRWAGPPILVDQGTDDPFLESQLKPELLRAACRDFGVPLELRLQDGYDHSYFFIATFIEDHLRFHAQYLR